MDHIDEDPFDFTITIPQGVKVLKMFGYSEQMRDLMLDLCLTNIGSGKVWCNPWTDGSFDAKGEDIKYIGVTPGKTYNLRCFVNDHNGGRESEASSYIRIYYSKSINEKVLDITDY